MIGRQILTLVNKGSRDVTQNLFNFVQSSPKSKPLSPLSAVIEYHFSLQQIPLCSVVHEQFHRHFYLYCPLIMLLLDL